MLFLPDFDLRPIERPRVVPLAEAALSSEPRRLTSARNPRSAGGAHDFSSEGDYWWPDEKNPDGAFVRRDGLTNPGNFTAHRSLMFAMARLTGRGATPAEWAKHGSYLMLEFGRWDARKSWTKQLHLGAMRNNNSRLL